LLPPGERVTPLLMKRLTPFLLLAAATVTRAADRPNILFVFSDDHAPHAIGAYNGFLKPVDPTPNIDKLAAEGMLFENSFCPIRSAGRAAR